MSRNIEIISIEGNIGSGKSTILTELKQYYADNAHVIFVREPVDEWENITDKDGTTMLQKFYNDPKTYSFPFQMMAYISRLKLLKDGVETALSLNTDKKVVIITERSLYTDKYVFAKMLYNQGNIEEVCYQIYTKWFDEFAKLYQIDKIIYINSSPTICFQRILNRDRLGESSIPLDYLIQCDNYHNEFIEITTKATTKATTKLILNGNIDILKDLGELSRWVKNIDIFIGVH